MATLQVFVSHHNEDSAFCHALVQGLRGAGADVWYDEHNMGSGMLLDTIEQEVRNRPVFVVILSPAALRSQWVRDECKWACMHYKRDTTRIIQPMLAGALPDEDDIPMYLQDFKRIEAPGLQPLPIAEAIRRLLHALALTPAGEAPAPVAPQPRESGDDLLERGNALIAQKRYADALPLIERATQLLPDSFSAWANLGVVLNMLKRYADALPAHDRALALDPANVPAWNNKGNALNGLGRSADALAALERALALDPSLAAAWDNKGNALDDLGRHEEALAAVERALAFDPTHAVAWNNKGNALNKLGRHAEALSVYERSLTLDARSARGWNGKARALRGLGRVAEAQAAERRAKELGG
jgi:tetratricopeptide (TPR) repeat protein